MTDIKQYIDAGNDLNNDKHCDLDGWFVDKNGNHRPVIRKITTAKELHLSNPKFKDVDVASYFDMNGSLGGIELNPLYVYSLDDQNIDLSSPNLNKYLRESGKNDSAKDKRIREIDCLINSSTLKKDLEVYRGVPLDFKKAYIKDILKLRPGDIYEDKGFLSTSHSQKVAVSYATKGSKDIIFFEINLKKGTHGMPLFKSIGSSDKEEFEILLKRNQKFVVENILAGEKTSKIVYVKLRSVIK